MTDDYTDFPKPTPELEDAIAQERGGLFMKYFVLKPAGDNDYAAASREAMFSYAARIAKTNRALSDHVYEWAVREHEKACGND